MKKEKRSRKFTVRFTEKEYANLGSKFKGSTSSQLSQYARSVLLGRPVVIKYRNQSLDTFMEEIILLRQELNAIGNNFNQAVKKLHTLKQIPDFRSWVIQNESLHAQILSSTNHISERINQMSEKWLQE